MCRCIILTFKCVLKGTILRYYKPKLDMPSLVQFDVVQFIQMIYYLVTWTSNKPCLIVLRKNLATEGILFV